MNIYLVGHNYQQQCQQIANLFDRTLCCVALTGNIQDNAAEYIISQLAVEQVEMVVTTRLIKGQKTLSKIAITINDLNDNLAVKRTIIRSLFDSLAARYHYRPDWGILVGVRPTKLVNSLFDSGYDESQIAAILAKRYYISEPKIELLLQVCRAERPYLQSLKADAISLYVGIPFCPSRCSYCSFTAQPAERGSAVIERYSDALIAEIKGLSEVCRGRYIDTLYFGGGTPALLTTQQIDRIFGAIRRYYQTAKIREITFEAGRPELIDEALLSALQRNGVDRICINPQTMHDKTLQKIGRSHNSADIRRAFELVKPYQFKAVNADLIAGLAGEDVEQFKQTLQQLLAFQPDNITIHTLALKRASQLAQAGCLNEAGASDTVAAQLQTADGLLHQAAYQPYYMYRQKNMLGNLENIGYSLADKASLYNIVIIEERQSIIAFGAATSSKIVASDGSLKQLHSPKNVALYTSNIERLIANKRAVIHSNWQLC